MKNFSRLLIVFIFSVNLVNARPVKFWDSIDENEIISIGERTISPKKYKTFRLVQDNLKNTLFNTPNEKKVELLNSQVIIELPMPDGTLQKFKVIESPVMATELGTNFPDIKTFNVQGIDDPTASGKIDWNSFGFHGMIRAVSGDIYIDPYCRNNSTDYIIYNTVDYKKDQSKKFIESEIINPKKDSKKSENLNRSIQQVCTGNTLATYRLAVACTGEYAIAATGIASPTIAQTLACIVTTINRVNGIFETEFAIKMVLVANETSILFTDSLSDPFTGNIVPLTLCGESQTVIDNIIGDANYDIGHTFCTANGGQVTSWGVYMGVCSAGWKASGISGSDPPNGDLYDVATVCHEMGHQFQASHTFTANTGGCAGNQNPSTEVEPGSGATIMSYAGICDNNDYGWPLYQDPSDWWAIPYFHTITFDEVTNYIYNLDGSTCPVITTTTNNSPVVTGSATYSIPKSTPFILTGSAVDPDGDALTYSWEETDLGLDNDWNSGQAPYFRTYIPTASPTRMFPKLSVVLSGNYTGTIGEYLPSTAQTLNFRLTARDNKMGGGGVCYSATQVVVTNTGPFTVTNPNATGVVWASNSSQTVTWNVNGTNSAPVSCSNVNILMSIDGGQTFTMILANTPNDGSQLITVPNQSSTVTTCRIKIECSGNIFFDINDNDFTISVLTSIAMASSEANPINIILVPNPVENLTKVTLLGINKSEKSVLNIYDIIGNTIYTNIFSGKENFEFNYDLSNLSKGVYILELKNSSQKTVTKLIKQ